MDELIKKVEEASLSVMDNDIDSFVLQANELNKMVWNIFPSIISVYSNEKMRDMANDALLWPQFLKKMIDVLSGQDLFKVLDVLYFELLPKLNELRDVLIERELRI